MRKVLVVDDEPAMREVLQLRLEQWGFAVETAADGGDASSTVEQWMPDVVITDVCLPDLSGIDLLGALKAGDPERPIILMTAYADVDNAVEAMKRGAQDFMTKPLDYERLRTVLESVENDLGWRAATRELVRTLSTDRGLGEIVGTSKSMRAIYRLIESVSPTDASAIITGESGTGKELVARTIHRLSRRADGPFVAINCAAIPEGISESELFGHEKGAFTGAIGSQAGCFERANGGTLFLDEVGEMSMALQPKLLRVLEERRLRRVGGRQERPVDVRLVAATHRDLEAGIEESSFRQDLFYRLNVFTVPLPALRKRDADVTLLAQHFVERFDNHHGTTVAGIGSAAIDRLAAYNWPGNVRELKNVIERAVILARDRRIECEQLPPFVCAPKMDLSGRIVLPADISLADAEETLIKEALRRTGNNKSEAARRLGLDPKTIRNKLAAYARRLVARAEST